MIPKGPAYLFAGEPGGDLTPLGTVKNFSVRWDRHTQFVNDKAYSYGRVGHMTLNGRELTTGEIKQIDEVLSLVDKARHREIVERLVRAYDPNRDPALPDLTKTLYVLFSMGMPVDEALTAFDLCAEHARSRGTPISWALEVAQKAWHQWACTEHKPLPRHLVQTEILDCDFEGNYRLDITRGEMRVVSGESAVTLGPDRVRACLGRNPTAEQVEATRTKLLYMLNDRLSKARMMEELASTTRRTEEILRAFGQALERCRFHPEIKFNRRRKRWSKW